MILVLLESPYAGDIDRNTRYARACMRDCLKRNEAPFASHLTYTQPGVLEDLKPDERALGIEAGLAWGARAEKTVVYTDLGLSNGMKLGIERALLEGRQVEYRTLGRSSNPGPGPCPHCGKPASCFGVYEDPEGSVERACDDCCGHGNEDGWCEPIVEPIE